MSLWQSSTTTYETCSIHTYFNYIHRQLYTENMKLYNQHNTNTCRQQKVLFHKALNLFIPYKYENKVAMLAWLPLWYKLSVLHVLECTILHTKCTMRRKLSPTNKVHHFFGNADFNRLVVEGGMLLSVFCAVAGSLDSLSKGRVAGFHRCGLLLWSSASIQRD